MDLKSALPQGRPVVLADGKTYMLGLFDLNCQSAMEDKYGINFSDASFQVGSLLGNTAGIRFLIYLLLRDNHPELTEHIVGRLILPSNMNDVYSAALKQFKASFPDLETGETKNEETPVAN